MGFQMTLLMRKSLFVKRVTQQLRESGKVTTQNCRSGTTTHLHKTSTMSFVGSPTKCSEGSQSPKDGHTSKGHGLRHQRSHMINEDVGKITDRDLAGVQALLSV